SLRRSHLAPSVRRFVQGILEQRHLLVPQLPRVPQRRLAVETHGAEGVGSGEQAHGTRSGAAGLPERLDARETTLARHCKRDLLGVILSKPLDAIHSEAKRRRGARGGTVESETRMIIVAWIRPFAS